LENSFVGAPWQGVYIVPGRNHHTSGKTRIFFATIASTSLRRASKVHV
jgi:hypothetical protein